jgi:hypothetical protein
MIAPAERDRHGEMWLLLPWLVNGRLTPAERLQVEEHVRRCAECGEELALQYRMCAALTEPDRVSYAPGPSFRKLMERIDDDDRQRKTARSGQKSTFRDRERISAWRPPGLAWAASFLLLFGVTGLLATAYRWSEPVYKTRSDAPVLTPNVLHIALDRSLTIRQVEEMLRTDGARVVEGPGSTGILGITPVDLVPGQTTTEAANRQLRSLAARLRVDSRVLWVQPLTDETPVDERAPVPQDH